jgi:hypothetical protein
MHDRERTDRAVDLPGNLAGADRRGIGQDDDKSSPP